MKKVKFPKLRKFIKGRGFAAALVLSVAAVGVSTYIAYNGAVSKLGEEKETEAPTFTEDAAAAEAPKGGVPKETNPPATQYVMQPVTPETSEAEQANNFVTPGTPKLIPVDGEVLVGFTNGELIKSNTLGVWRTHDAVDIGAALGSEVKAMQKGTVVDVRTDALWGVSITIDHGEGVVSEYMGLDKDVKVEVGQVVEAGDIIALVGNTAEAEIADPPHLHFAVKKNDVWIDPFQYIES